MPQTPKSSVYAVIWTWDRSANYVAYVSPEEEWEYFEVVVDYIKKLASEKCCQNTLVENILDKSYRKKVKK